MSADRYIEEGIVAQRAGRLDDARALYLSAISENGSAAEAWNLLGVVECQSGRFDTALEYSRKAVALDPSSAEYAFSLGECLRGIGLLDSALQAYQVCLKSWPKRAELYFVLGQLYARQGNVEEAAEALATAVNLRPRFHMAHEMLAAYRLKAGDFTSAEALCREALLIPSLKGPLDPQAARFHAYLGDAARGLGKYENALASYEEASRLRPNWAAVRARIAQCLNILHSYERAASTAAEATQADPDCFIGHVERGTALDSLERPAAAKESFGEALRIRPDAIAIQMLYARTHLKTLSHEVAIELYRRAIELAPSNADVHEGILVAMNYAAGVEDRAVFEEHVNWACHATGLGASPPVRPLRNSKPDRPLRVGFVSPDLHRHSVPYFFEPILSNVAGRSFEAIVFNDSLKTDDFTERLRSLASEWHDTAKVDHPGLVKLVMEREIDILVDLAGHTLRNRLAVFIRRPAPIQVSYLGYANTTGLSREWMQYRLTDALCDPAGESDQMHSEELVRLGAPFLCYSPPDDAPDPSALPASDTGFVTFGSFNNMMKITRPMLDIWARILETVPGSHLLIKNKCASDPSVKDLIIEALARHDISRDRLIFRPPELTTEQHLSRYDEIDIAIDTYPYNGTTTTCEAMWMGVPVVSLAGTSHRSRVGKTLLTSVGLEQLIAETPDQYIQIAADLASDVERLAQLRSGFRDRMRGSTLMDANRLVNNLESAFREMWQTACAQGG